MKVYVVIGEDANYDGRAAKVGAVYTSREEAEAKAVEMDATDDGRIWRAAEADLEDHRE